MYTETEDDAAEPVSWWTRKDWFALAAVGVAALVVRLVNLSKPKDLIFDEVYYAKDACWYVNHSASICKNAHEASWVHPPLGKWLIALGERIFGFNSLGWRIVPLVAGVATVALLYVLARKLLGSTWSAVLVAGLFALDLLAFVQSRVAMLDVFVPMFGVAAVLFVLLDRDRMLARAGEVGARSGLLNRPWRLAAGLACGAAAASKWSGALFLVVVLLLTIVWELSWRYTARVPREVWSTLKEESASIVLFLLIAPAAVYLFTYVGRLNPGDMHYLESSGFCSNLVGSIPHEFIRLHRCMLAFHRNLKDMHSYQSPPWSWILIKRPVSYFYEAPGGNPREIMATGDPFVWWASILALLYVAWRWIRRRVDGPEGVILAGFVLTYLPWIALAYGRPAVFIFYLLPSVPFMYLALGYVASQIGSSWEARTAITGFVAGAVGLFVFYYPLAAGVAISQDAWSSRIWIFQGDQCDKGKGTPVSITVTATLENGKVTESPTTSESTDSVPPVGWCWI